MWCASPLLHALLTFRLTFTDIEAMVGQHHIFFFADGPDELTEEFIMDKITKSAGVSRFQYSVMPTAFYVTYGKNLNVVHCEGVIMTDRAP